MRITWKSAGVSGLVAGTTLLAACDINFTGPIWGGDGNGGGGGGGWGPFRIVTIAPEPVLEMGDTVRLTATFDDTGVDDPVQGTFTWFVGDTALASIDGEGLLTGRLPGWTDIQAVHDNTGTPGAIRATVAVGDAPTSFATFRALAVGGVACGLDAEGAAWCWGPDFAGLLGTGAMDAGRSTPTAMGNEVPFTSVYAGPWSVCGLAVNGTGYCWGENGAGELGVGDFERRARPAPIASDLAFHSLALSAQHACGVTVEGPALCWGDNEWGQLGTGQTGQRSPTPEPIAGALELVEIAVGEVHTCGIDADSLAWCWGANDRGQLGDGTTTDRAAPVPVAGDHRFVKLATLAWGPTCAIDGAGRLFCWGPRLSNLAETDVRPELVDEARRYRQVTGTSGHFCALAENADAFCWGENGTGQLGDGTIANRTAPVAVAGGHRFTAIAAGAYYTCGIATDGQTLCWGDNQEGRLGTGTLVSSRTPVPVVTLD